MDFLFDFIAELIFDTALNGAVSAAGNRKLPQPVRYLILTLIMLLYTAFFLFMFLVAFLLMRDGQFLLGAIMLAIGALMLVLSIRKFRAVCTKARKSSSEDDNKGEEI